MELSGFPGKILVPRKRFLIFYLSPNVVPKVNEQSCSNSKFMVLLQLSLARPFHFRPAPNIKGSLMLRLVHLRKNLKFSFSQKWLQRFLSNFVGLLHIRISTIWYYRLFPEKFLM